MISRTRGLVHIALAIAGGAVAGVVTTTLTTRGAAPPPAASAVSAPGTPGWDEARIKALEALVQPSLIIVSANGVPASAPPPAAPVTSAGTVSVPSASLPSMIAEARKEVRDPQWASAMAATMQKDFDKLVPTFKATVDAVDCRNVSCIVKLRWPSFNEAFTSLEKLETFLPTSRCGVAVSLDPPPDPKAVYTTEILLDCQVAKYPAAGQ